MAKKKKKKYSPTSKWMVGLGAIMLSLKPNTIIILICLWILIFMVMFDD